MGDIVPQSTRKRQLRTDPIFYVYFLYRGESQVPFYVGKGCKQRINGHEMCARNHPNCPHLTCRVIRKEWREERQIRKEKVADGIPEQSAFNLERFFIALGAIYHWPLVNKTIGGEGVSGVEKSAEWRQSHSQHMKELMKAPERIEKVRQAHIGRVHSDEEREKRRKGVTRAWSDPELKELKSMQSKQLWESEEFREKHQQGMSSPETRAKLSYWKGKESPKAKTYPGFMSPNGTIYSDVKNLTRFAREHGLQVSGMCLVAQGKQLQHLGWTLYPPIDERSHYRKEFSFVSPTGEVYANIPHLSDFCEQHGLRQNMMSEVASGKRKSYKGWTKYDSGINQPKLFS